LFVFFFFFFPVFLPFVLVFFFGFVFRCSVCLAPSRFKKKKQNYKKKETVR